MRFVHQHEHLNEDGIVIIECSQQRNTRLINDANFRSFKSGGRHSYHSGAFDRSPAKIKVLSTGFWNITIDTVARRPISVTRKPNFKWLVKFACCSGSQFT